MNNNIHCVIGGAGDAAVSTVNALKRRNLPVRSIARTQGAPGIDFVSANILEVESLRSAVQGASHVYACMGFTYRKNIWKEVWPQAIRNLVEVCATQSCKLIFLDNIYMYGPAPLQVPITEDHPCNPVSEKGKIRKEIADFALEHFNSGKVKGLIGRSPDFYGPHVKNSSIHYILYDAIKNKRAIMWPVELSHKHSLIYIDDLGEALVELALDDQANGQVWHVPVADHPNTLLETFEKIRDCMGVQNAVKSMPGWIFSLMSLFSADVRELNEMLYQYRSDYIFDSQKFLSRYPHFKVTSYEVGYKKTAEAYK